MTGCLPHDSPQQPPQAFYTLATHGHAEAMAASRPPPGDTQPDPGPMPPLLLYTPHSQPEAEYMTQHRPYKDDPVFQQPCAASTSADAAVTQHRYDQSWHQSNVQVPHLQAQKPPQSSQSETTFLHPCQSGPNQKQQYHLGHSTQVLRSQQQSVARMQEVSSHGQPVSQSYRVAASHFQPPAPLHHHYRSPEPQRYRLPPGPLTAQPAQSRPGECSAQWQQSRQLCCEQPSLSFAPRSPQQPVPAYLTSGPAGHPYPGLHSACAVKTVPASQPEHQPQTVTTPVSQQSYQTRRPVSPSAMQDKKPSLQMVTDHSAVGPGSSRTSPHFVCPNRQASPSGNLGSTNAGSPYMSPVKQEAKWVVVTPPRSSDTDSPMLQVHRERRFMLTSGSEAGELADSETSSSIVEESSSSSREQSPFSTMAKNLSLHSPEDPPSSITPKPPKLEIAMAACHEEDPHRETEGSGDVHSSSLLSEAEAHPPKFKRRLHERYMHSLKDTSEIPQKIKEESIDSCERCYMENEPDSERVMPKLERMDSPAYSETHMLQSSGGSSSDTDTALLPKSSYRSLSDTDRANTESTEIGASSPDEGDVFMEPPLLERTKSRPPSLHQREPLDLSRGHLYFHSSSGSSPLLDPEHLSPASKIFSPVFRSPHRLPYSPHGLMSPQSQSPLCSVPEGGRIFNFNVPSPLEGAHSDSDLISPSPVSPRIFTFPPHSSLQNPGPDVNRLALSPRAPYTPPPSFLRGKPFGSGRVVHSSKWGDEHFFSKRSLSESDMTYLCPVCGHMFASNDSLAKHVAKHLPSETVRTGDTKIHYCKVCNRSFSRSDMLTRHLRLHTGLKPYECFDCGQVFSRSDHLNTHRRTHTGEKPYHCPHCPYSACRRDMITRHLRTHTKRTPRRSRYLSVPDDGDSHRPSGSVSSTDRTDSQDFSVSGHTCSVSSMDSVESESIHSSRPPPNLGTSMDSLLSPDQDHLSMGPHSSPSSRKMSDGADEGELGLEAASSYDPFLQYRKGRNWSTTSVESVDSEEAVVIREVLVDDAFIEPEMHPTRPRKGDSMGGEAMKGNRDICADPTDLVGIEAQNLQKCFISSQTRGKNDSVQSNSESV